MTLGFSCALRTSVPTGRPLTYRDFPPNVCAAEMRPIATDIAHSVVCVLFVSVWVMGKMRASGDAGFCGLLM